MSEQVWRTTTDPLRLLLLLQHELSERKLRLFTLGVCRHYWHLFKAEPSRHALETSELFADGLTTAEQLQEATAAALGPTERAWWATSVFTPTLDPQDWKLRAARVATMFDAHPRRGAWTAWFLDEIALIVKMHPFSWESWFDWGKVRRTQAALLRDVAGNPFQPPAVDRSWLSWNFEAVVKLAEAIYAERAFDRLPILADALEDAGCSDAAILNHCRQPGEHVRGCWIIDLLTGRQ